MKAAIISALVIAVGIIFLENLGNTHKVSDTTGTMFQIDTLQAPRVTMGTYHHFKIVGEKGKDLAYKKQVDSPWVVLDSAAALMVALNSLENYSQLFQEHAKELNECEKENDRLRKNSSRLYSKK